MHVYICSHVCVCMHMHMCAHVHVYMYTHIGVCMNMGTCTPMLVCVCARVCVRSYLCLYAREHVCAHVHVCMHVCACAYRGQRLVLELFLYQSPCYLSRYIFSMNLELTDWQDRLANLRDLHIFCTASSEVAGTCCYVRLFAMGT